jgi:hypothetical protein
MPIMSPVSPKTQPADRRPLFSETLAHLRRAQRLPLSVICHGLARWDAPDIDHIEVERAVELAQANDVAAAVVFAVDHLARGIHASTHDPDLRFASQFVAVTDADGGLVLAGEVRAGSVVWCHPVASDAEARQVVTEASRLRAEAAAISERGDGTVSDALLNGARALEGRLVDPFWRSSARAEIVRCEAA